MNSKVLIVITNHEQMGEQHKTGVWLPEFTEPCEVFKKSGIAVTVASPKGGEAPIDPNSLNLESEVKWKDLIQELKQTVSLEKIDVCEYDAIFLPGGHGTMFDLPSDLNLQLLLREFAEANKYIAAVCHGPAGFVGATLSNGEPLVRGKRLTAFTNEEETKGRVKHLMPFLLEDRLKELGAIFVTGPAWADHIEQDGLLITGQNPQSSISVAHALAEALKIST